MVNDSVHSPIEAALKFPLPSSDAVVCGFSVGNDRAIAVAKAKAAEVAYKEKQKGRAVATAANVQGAVWETTVYPLPYNVEVTIEPEDEMSKFVLLSLHGIPKPPKKEQHAEKRADAWYARFLSGEEGLKHVAINDEMQGGTNLTVRLSSPPPWISFWLSSVFWF